MPWLEAQLVNGFEYDFLRHGHFGQNFKYIAYTRACIEHIELRGGNIKVAGLVSNVAKYWLTHSNEQKISITLREKVGF